MIRAKFDVCKLWRIKTNTYTVDMTKSEISVNDIEPIYGTCPESISDYNDVLELFKKSIMNILILKQKAYLRN